MTTTQFLFSFVLPYFAGTAIGFAIFYPLALWIERRFFK